MIRIIGHPIRHKKRIEKIKNRFEATGEQVEVIYKNINHINITNGDKENKNTGN